MSRVERMVLDIGGPGDLSKLHGLPASLSFAAMILTRLRRGRLDMSLPDGRILRFMGKEHGPMAELIVHDLKFVRTAAARGDVGFAEAFIDGKVDTPDLPLLLEYFNANWENIGPFGLGGAIAMRFLWLCTNTPIIVSIAAIGSEDCPRCRSSCWTDIRTSCRLTAKLPKVGRRDPGLRRPSGPSY